MNIKDRITKIILKNNFEYYFLLAVGLLLAIWTISETIALRNILMTILSIASLLMFISKKNINIYVKQISTYDVLIYMMILVAVYFIGYHAFSYNSFDLSEMNELVSVFIRSTASLIIGFGAGYFLLLKPRLTAYLGFGIFILFIYELTIDIKVLNEASLAVSALDYSKSIYLGKINAVFSGGILIALIISRVFDCYKKQQQVYLKELVYWLGVPVLLFYIYYYHLRSNTGVLTLFLLAIILLSSIIYISIYRSIKFSINFNKWNFIVVFFYFLLFTAMFWIILNSAFWKNIIENASVGFDTKTYKNWINTSKFGPPDAPSGRPIPMNAYERAAYASIGIDMIIQNPIGHGRSSEPLKRALLLNYNDTEIASSNAISTHSAFLDIALTYGVITSASIFIIFFAVLIKSVANIDQLKTSAPIWIAIIMLIMLSIGEASRKHFLEIIFFCLSFIFVLSKPSNK
ncbi:hypothetical protein [Polynucleobacter sp. Adler-ghost]|uniref:hypothetical protein n=1 Tax=Polynucleobacter sp. Adler-ghost TaxID=2770234 RepID=UPI001BFDB68B|nr:hypothetical protein [Polynucleobacter sp. Adler-ghost]